MEACRLHPFASELAELQVMPIASQRGQRSNPTSPRSPISNGEIRNLGGRSMTWKTPKIVEVSVGMEINMYACATRK